MEHILMEVDNCLPEVHHRRTTLIAYLTYLPMFELTYWSSWKQLNLLHTFAGNGVKLFGNG